MERNKGRFVARHGDNTTRGRAPEYWVWQSMIARCEYPGAGSYANYGARGIKVCERWHSYENFLADMGRRPSPTHSIERKDRDGNYEPSNCLWASRTEQARNRSDNHMLTFRGRTQCITDWSAEVGLSVQALWWRLKHGWTEEEALTRPARALSRRCANG